jgi:hypothetical protein
VSSDTAGGGCAWEEKAAGSRANPPYQLGHAFDHTAPGGDTVGNRYSSQKAKSDPDFPSDYTGFAKGYTTSENENDASNYFANMFVGWVTGEWAGNAAGDSLAGTMNGYMSEFLK